jgi:hypothetical protein
MSIPSRRLIFELYARKGRNRLLHQFSESTGVTNVSNRRIRAR